MKVIESMFYGRIDETNRALVPTEFDDEERRAYEALKATFTPEQETLFYSLYETHCRAEEQRRCNAYERGVKTGVHLGMELKDFTPSQWKNE